jgi:hypothetical protein
LSEDCALVPSYVFMVQTITPNVHNGREGNFDLFERCRYSGDANRASSANRMEIQGVTRDVQPVKLSIVCEAEDEFIDNAIDRNRSTYEFKACIC